MPGLDRPQRVILGGAPETRRLGVLFARERYQHRHQVLGIEAQFHALKAKEPYLQS